MHETLSPADLLTLMEAFTRRRTEAHAKAGHTWPLDQTELLLDFKEWVSGLGPAAAQALLQHIDTPDADAWMVQLPAFGDGAIDHDIAQLKTAIGDALALYARKRPGSSPSVTLSYTTSTMQDGETAVRETIEINVP